MILSGERELAPGPAQVWARFRDARFLVHCIPEATCDPQSDTTRAQCTVRPGFAFVRGSLDVTLTVVEAVEPHSVRLRVESKGIGSSSDVEATVTLVPHQAGTRASWTVDVQRLGGLLRAVPSGLVRGAAHKVIEDVWKEVEARLAGTGER
jgi:carbon monoxide dehydrogenase subunit G